MRLGRGLSVTGDEEAVRRLTEVSCRPTRKRRVEAAPPVLGASSLGVVSPLGLAEGRIVSKSGGPFREG